MNFVFGLPKDCDGNTGIVVFADRLSKMDHLAAVLDSVDGKCTAMMLVNRVFRQHGCRWQSSLIATLASLESFGLLSSTFLARDWRYL